ncbi:myosin tail [Syncephalis fuscata]|nr:myosin tail [Syncephalis fuscata]
MDDAAARLKKADSAAATANAEMLKEREVNKELLRAKVALENQTKELNLRIVELETGSMTMRPQRIETRAESITFQLESEARLRNETLRSARKTDRMVRDLQFQLAESEKSRERSKEEMEKLDQRLTRTRTQLEELESSEGALQLAKRRAEREANEQKERALR